MQYLTRAAWVVSLGTVASRAHCLPIFWFAASGHASLSALTQGDVEAFCRAPQWRDSRATRCSTWSRKCARFYDFATTAVSSDRVSTRHRHAAHLSRRVAAARDAWLSSAGTLRIHQSRRQVGLAGLLHSASDRTLRAAAIRSGIAPVGFNRLGDGRLAGDATQDALGSDACRSRRPRSGVLSQYLAIERDRQGRTHPELFLRARCPNGPLLRTAIGDIFEKRMRAAKIGPTSLTPTACGTPSPCICSREASE